MRIKYWVKFKRLSPRENFPPELWVCENLDEFWHRLRDHFLRHQVAIVWMIEAYD